jgi:hypothetical protein
MMVATAFTPLEHPWNNRTTEARETPIFTSFRGSTASAGDGRSESYFAIV